MSKRSGYMLVRYSRYVLPDENENDVYKASGRKVCVCLDSASANAKLKEMLGEVLANPGLTLTSKNLRSGWFTYQSSGCKMLVAKMPYSNKHINDTLL